MIIHVDKVVFSILVLWMIAITGVQWKMQDNMDNLKSATELIATGLLETKMHCDVAGERTDELWVEVFND